MYDAVIIGAGVIGGMTARELSKYHMKDTTLESLKSSKADMMEIMPGVVPKVIASLKKQLELPIIAGGLIETAEEIESALKAGADAISTGQKEFWRKSE